MKHDGNTPHILTVPEHLYVLYFKQIKSSLQRPYRSQLYRIILIITSPTNILIESIGMYFPPEPSRTPLESLEEGGIPDSQLQTSFKQTKNQHKWLATHLTFRNQLYVLYYDIESG